MDSNAIDVPSNRLHTLLGEFDDADASLSYSIRETEIQLAPYEEVCGALIAVKQDSVAVHVVLSVGTLRYPLISPEAGICLAQLPDHIGHRVSILRVPSQTSPIRIHVAKPTRVEQESGNYQ